MISNPINTVINWNYFCLNFSSNFIKKCWSDDIFLAEHLEEKFHSIYVIRGTGLMPFFFSELSRDNQIKLIKWVNENYCSWPDLKDN